MKFIGWLSTFVVFAFFRAIYSGYVLSVMWDWFIVSHFGLKAIPIPIAIGLGLIISFMTKQDTDKESNDKSLTDVLIKGFVMALFKPTIFLFLGWVVTFFI